MREIKFRAWDGEEWYVPTYVDGQWQVRTVAIPRFNSPIVQYTGLKDKNGKEIYEGDVVCADRYTAYYFEVVFHEGAFRQKDASGRIFAQVTGETEVVGNIYENPELLTA